MTTPFAYQDEDCRAIDGFGGRALLAWEMGLGKTYGALLWLSRHPEALPAVVVCPASVKYNWSRESSRHVGMRAEVLEGTRPPRRPVGRTPPITVVNYDILSPTKTGPGWLDELKRIRPKLVVIDEAHYCADPSTKRSKAVRELCRDVPHVLALSGTPLVNRPIELWPVLDILKPRAFGSRFNFAMKFCGAKHNGYGWSFKGASNLDQLHDLLLSTVMIRRRKIDVLKDLPPKIRSVIPLPLSDPLKYRKAETDFLQWLADEAPDKAIGAARAEGLVKAGYLKRLAAKLKMRAVLSWVDDWLEESDGKLVVFGIHKAIIAELKARYGKQCVTVDGSVTGRKRQYAVDQFQNDTKTRVFIGNVKAAGVGISLTASSDVAFCEMGWTPGEMVQAEDRIHRIGQTRGAQVTYLVARGTIEEALAGLIQRKAETLGAVLDGDEAEELDIYDQLVDILKREERK